ncbi:hypothetical protein [Flavobacterium sp. 14A]|uniref:hypothetical protein n=1 Tax=Flavobacterium sp. 14A TaxID=2735896 RepID=UPI00156DAA43|nr:hypothetical protein [Flavobacterium sp. 14A]NRT11537.1 hypothetical protein [Flavobacterium sp. 14A]
MRINYNIPQKWNDLTESQIRFMGRFMFNSRNEQISNRAFKLAVLSVLLVPKFTIKNIVKAVLLWSDVPFSELEQYTAFVFDNKELLTRFPSKIKSGKWPFRKTVYGPAARLANVTIQELSYADLFYYKWATENNVADLHRLTAILFREKKGNNREDIRAPFSTLLLEHNARITDKIPLAVKFMIAHAYSGCRENFINRNPNVFPRPKQVTDNNVEDIEQQPVKKQKPYEPFSKIIESMAMDDVQVFGNHQETEKVYAAVFLSVLDEKIVRSKELERKNQLNK